MSETRDGDDAPRTPRMLRLVLVCIAVWIFCGVLTWFAFAYLDRCCDMSGFSKLFE